MWVSDVEHVFWSTFREFLGTCFFSPMFVGMSVLHLRSMSVGWSSVLWSQLTSRWMNIIWCWKTLKLLILGIYVSQSADYSRSSRQYHWEKCLAQDINSWGSSVFFLDFMHTCPLRKDLGSLQILCKWRHSLPPLLQLLVSASNFSGRPAPTDGLEGFISTWLPWPRNRHFQVINTSLQLSWIFHFTETIM